MYKFQLQSRIPDNTDITGVFATVIAYVYVGCMTRHVHIHISRFKKFDTSKYSNIISAVNAAYQQTVHTKEPRDGKTMTEIPEQPETCEGMETGSTGEE